MLEVFLTDAREIHVEAIETSIMQAYWPEDLVFNHLIVMLRLRQQKSRSCYKLSGLIYFLQMDIWGTSEQGDAEKGRMFIEKLVRDKHELVAKLLEPVNTYHI